MRDESFPGEDRIWALPPILRDGPTQIHNASYAYVSILSFYGSGTFYGEVCKSDIARGLASHEKILLLL